jgi:hypothetical protein
MNDAPKKDEKPIRNDFWKRQFLPPSTNEKLIFDVAFGILMPIICFYFDPGFIRNSSTLSFSLELQSHSIFIYCLCFLAMIVLIFWLIFGKSVRLLNGIIGGILLGGGITSLIIGIYMLPFSLLGMLFLIGFIGFVPFLTAFVYFRNALLAINSMGLSLNRALLVASVLFGAFLIISISVAVQWKTTQIVTQAMDDVLSQDPTLSQTAIERLENLQWLINTDEIVWKYEKEPDKSRKENLARAYKEITGENIESRFFRSRD